MARCDILTRDYNYWWKRYCVPFQRTVTMSTKRKPEVFADLRLTLPGKQTSMILRWGRAGAFGQERSGRSQMKNKNKAHESISKSRAFQNPSGHVRPCREAETGSDRSYCRSINLWFSRSKAPSSPEHDVRWHLAVQLSHRTSVETRWTALLNMTFYKKTHLTSIHLSHRKPDGAAGKDEGVPFVDAHIRSQGYKRPS